MAWWNQDYTEAVLTLSGLVQAQVAGLQIALLCRGWCWLMRWRWQWWRCWCWCDCTLWHVLLIMMLLVLMMTVLIIIRTMLTNIMVMRMTIITQIILYFKWCCRYSGWCYGIAAAMPKLDDPSHLLSGWWMYPIPKISVHQPPIPNIQTIS